MEEETATATATADDTTTTEKVGMTDGATAPGLAKGIQEDPIRIRTADVIGPGLQTDHTAADVASEIEATVMTSTLDVVGTTMEGAQEVMGRRGIEMVCRIPFWGGNPFLSCHPFYFVADLLKPQTTAQDPHPPDVAQAPPPLSFRLGARVDLKSPAHSLRCRSRLADRMANRNAKTPGAVRTVIPIVATEVGGMTNSEIAMMVPSPWMKMMISWLRTTVWVIWRR